MTRALQTSLSAVASMVNTRVSRRAFVKATGLGGAALAATMGGTAIAMPDAGEGRRRPLRHDDILFLLSRTTCGFAQDWYEYAKALGYRRFLDQQLNPETIDDSEMDQLLQTFPSLAMSYGELYTNYTVQGLDYIPYYELKFATILRRIYSNRQLHERMVEFWTDHFNIDHNKDAMATFKVVDDREVIRKHALGKFPDLLAASAHSGAMMVYLDNYLNSKFGSNENYAREILELHALGVNGGYTEQDIKELARCLTGWSIDYGAEYGRFLYYDYLHDQGTKWVLGYYIGPHGGRSDMETLLLVLATHPSTAKFIATKMCRWLLTYEPPQWLVDRVTNTYLNTGGDIKAMIRDILDPAMTKEMMASRFRRPGEVPIWLARATKADITDFTGLFYEYYPLGQMPFDWSPPNGYPDSIEAWGSALQPRWNFISRLFDAQVFGTRVKPAIINQLLGDIPDSELAQGINRVLTGGSMASEDVADIQEFLDTFASPRDWPVLRQAFALAAQSSSAQFH